MKSWWVWEWGRWRWVRMGQCQGERIKTAVRPRCSLQCTFFRVYGNLMHAKKKRVFLWRHHQFVKEKNTPSLQLGPFMPFSPPPSPSPLCTCYLSSAITLPPSTSGKTTSSSFSCRRPLMNEMSKLVLQRKKRAKQPWDKKKNYPPPQKKNVVAWQNWKSNLF